MRIIVIDDHEVVREGLVATLSRDCRDQVVGVGSSAVEALELARRCAADLAIIDLRLPDKQGDVLCRELRAAFPSMAVVILTTYLSEEAVRGALSAGAAAYVTKAAGLGYLRETLDQLRDAPPSVQHAPQIVKQLHDQVAARMGTQRPTPRQERVLELAAQGLTNREVGDRMFISESTVRFHIQKLKETMGARTKTELVAKAIRLGAIASAPEHLSASP